MFKKLQGTLHRMGEEMTNFRRNVKISKQETEV